MKTILVVDDEYALAETLVEVLTEEGYRAVSASNGRQGFERVQKDKPDLLLTDFMMPLSDGLDLIQRVRALPDFETLPIVLMSSTAKEVALSSARNAAALNVAVFLPKPFYLDQLLTVVHRLIGTGEIL